MVNLIIYIYQYGIEFVKRYTLHLNSLNLLMAEKKTSYVKFEGENYLTDFFDFADFKTV